MQITSTSPVLILTSSLHKKSLLSPLTPTALVIRYEHMRKKAPKKKVLKKLDVHSNDDVKRYVGAVAEHFGDQVSAVAEQISGLYEKFDVVDKRFDEVDKRFDEVDKRFGEVDKKLNIHTEMIGGIMEDVAIIKSDVEFLKAGMRAKVDYKDFEALERRVRLMEAKMRR